VPPVPAPRVPESRAVAGPEVAAGQTVTPSPAAARREPDSLVNPLPRWLVPAAAVGLVLLAVWAGSRMLRSHGDAPRPVANPIASPQTSAPQAAPSSVTAQSAPSPVVHQEIPVVSRGAHDSIRGQIKVAVRVTVDRGGNVVAENLEVHGSSRYFARLATEAAKKWKFAPADNSYPREWLVQFEFSHGGVTGQAVPRVRP
jgi:hypothetical protein